MRCASKSGAELMKRGGVILEDMLSESFAAADARRARNVADSTRAHFSHADRSEAAVGNAQPAQAAEVCRGASHEASATLN
jgi:hypothetical protein